MGISRPYHIVGAVVYAYMHEYKRISILMSNFNELFEWAKFSWITTDNLQELSNCILGDKDAKNIQMSSELLKL